MDVEHVEGKLEDAAGGILEDAAGPERAAEHEPPRGERKRGIERANLDETDRVTQAGGNDAEADHRAALALLLCPRDESGERVN